MIPGLVFKSTDVSKPAPGIIYVHPGGKDFHREKTADQHDNNSGWWNYGRESSYPGSYLEDLVKEGYIVLAIDYRGIGETYPRIVYHKSEEYVLTADSVLLGKHILGMRVWDVVRAADYLISRSDVDSTRISCLGQGLEGGLLAILGTILTIVSKRS